MYDPSERIYDLDEVAEGLSAMSLSPADAKCAQITVAALRLAEEQGRENSLDALKTVQRAGRVTNCIGNEEARQVLDSQLQRCVAKMFPNRGQACSALDASCPAMLGGVAETQMGGRFKQLLDDAERLGEHATAFYAVQAVQLTDAAERATSRGVALALFERGLALADRTQRVSWLYVELLHHLQDQVPKIEAKFPDRETGPMGRDIERAWSRARTRLASELEKWRVPTEAERSAAVLEAVEGEGLGAWGWSSLQQVEATKVAAAAAGAEAAGAYAEKAEAAGKPVDAAVLNVMKGKLQAFLGVGTTTKPDSKIPGWVWIVGGVGILGTLVLVLRKPKPVALNPRRRRRHSRRR